MPTRPVVSKSTGTLYGPIYTRGVMHGRTTREA